MSDAARRAPSPPGSGNWLEPWILSTLQDLQRGMGELIGAVRSNEQATHRRIDDLRGEMVHRLARLEAEVRTRPAAAPAAPAETTQLASRLWDLARGLPWGHILTLAALGLLGALGYVSPAEIKRYLFGS